VPEIIPQAVSAASIPVVVAPEATATGVEVPEVGWFS
jgi:hypothetical protein